MSDRRCSVLKQCHLTSFCLDSFRSAPQEKALEQFTDHEAHAAQEREDTIRRLAMKAEAAAAAVTQAQVQQSQQLRAAMEDRLRNDAGLLRMREARARLPAWKCQQELVDAVRRNQVTIVAGETGCGKTTQLPQFILDDLVMRGEGAGCKIICTQPRRISATSVATRVSAERSEKIGGTVGYAIRLEKISGPNTRILFCTTGVLLRRLIADPLLDGTSHIIVDEVRSEGPPLRSNFFPCHYFVFAHTLIVLCLSFSQPLAASLPSAGARALPRQRFPARAPTRLPPASAVPPRRPHERDPRRQGLFEVLWRRADAHHSRIHFSSGGVLLGGRPSGNGVRAGSRK